jgi:PilZ domain
MRILSNFKMMPRNIQIICLVFLAIPPGSTVLFESPLTTYFTQGQGHSFIFIATYWLLPMCICYTILIKHYLFLPFYLLQCVALGVHSFFNTEALPTDFLIMRFSLVMLMTYIGILFSNRDFLYPFITKQSRYWRRSPRMPVTFAVQLFGDKPGQRIPATMENCSSSGMAVSIEPKHLSSFIQKKEQGETLKTVLRWGGREHVIAVRIAWIAKGPTMRLGFRAVDEEIMGEFTEWVQNEIEYRSRFNPSVPGERLLAHDMHQTALTLWVVFILLSFGLPAFALV